MSSYGISNEQTTLPFSEGIEITKQYEVNGTWSDKVLYCLRELDGGFVTDITKKILEYEPELNEAKVKSSVTINASQLKTNNKIGAKTVGIKNRYFLL